MRLGSRGGGGARVCMRWDGRGGVRGGRSESEWVGIGRNRGFSDTWLVHNPYMLQDRIFQTDNGHIPLGCGNKMSAAQLVPMAW